MAARRKTRDFSRFRSHWTTTSRRDHTTDWLAVVIIILVGIGVIVRINRALVLNAAGEEQGVDRSCSSRFQRPAPISRRSVAAVPVCHAAIHESFHVPGRMWQSGRCRTGLPAVCRCPCRTRKAPKQLPRVRSTSDPISAEAPGPHWDVNIDKPSPDHPLHLSWCQPVSRR